MPENPLRSRAPRFQFSLRGLLVLMAFVGIAIVVYRLPWTETKQQPWMKTSLLYGEDSPGTDRIVRESGRWQHQWGSQYPTFSANEVDDYRIATNFRRGWNGKPQKNGLRQYWRLHETKFPLLVMEKHYVDDDVRRIIHYADSGEIAYVAGRLNGVPHGELDVSLQARREYEHGKRVGLWHTSYVAGTLLVQDASEAITVQQSYRAGLLHGEWIWKGADERILQSAKYDQGRLVEWNGLPKEAAIEKLLAQCGLTDEGFAKLQRPGGSAILIARKSSEPKFSDWGLEIDGQSSGLVISSRSQTMFDRWVLVVNREFIFPADQAPVEALLEEALSTSETLVVRSGKLFVVKISAAELDAGQ